MPGGNIIQYTQTNPGADRLMLVRRISLEIDEGNLLTWPTIACTGVPRPYAPSWVRYFAWWHRSGKQTEEMSEPAC